jgi:hypothetical protein
MSAVAVSFIVQDADGEFAFILVLIAVITLTLGAWALMVSCFISHQKAQIFDEMMKRAKVFKTKDDDDYYIEFDL